MPGYRHGAIIAPAGPVKPEVVNNGAAFLESRGLRVSVMPHVQDGAPEKYFSASLEQRVDDLHRAWRDPEIDLIVCARGGFGSMQLLPYLDWNLLRSRAVPVLGLSDITALHLGMLKNGAGIPVSSVMLSGMMKAGEFTLRSLRFALGAEEGTFELPAQLLKDGRDFTALPRALNLSVAAAMCGTPYMPDLSGSFLVLEDLNEPPYRIERGLMQLQMCGVLAQCAGLAFGQFTGCGTTDEMELIYRKYAAYVDGPVWTGFPFGHESGIAALNWNVPVTCRGGGLAVLQAQPGLLRA
jgi:muramoyltetrapeptide carboxypeptidase